jgi:molybdenum cofactor cytidylyltransferase
MRFGMIPLQDAEGAILAHSVKTPSGALKKGRVLSGDDIARLREAGIEEVMAARFEPGDVPEDQAADRTARAAAGDNIEVAAAFTGRANLFAKVHGLAVIDQTKLLELNRLHEGLTIATVAAFEKVTPGQMAATIKVITFSVPEEAVAHAEALLASNGGLVSIAPFAKKAAGLVLTQVAGTKQNVLEKRTRTMGERLQALGSELGDVEICEHNEDAVLAAIGKFSEKGLDPILVFGASAIVDRGDVIPAAVEAAGGEIVHMGMPVDPGNLLLVGRLPGADVIGVPSCAGTPKVNGFDWVLERRLAGLPVGADEVTAMGLGGLLKEVQGRPQPRVQDREPSRRAPRIAVIVLAAGRSTRMGKRNKLLEKSRGAPIVRHVVQAGLESQASQVVVVTGHQSGRVRDALKGLDVDYAENPNYGEGLSTSLKAGLDSLGPGLDGAIISLGDMPEVQACHLDRLIAAFAPKEGRAICVPIREGRRGNPVLWGAEFFDEMGQVRGDAGARHLIGQYEDQVAEVDLASDAIFVDIDTPEALGRLREGALND